MPAFLRIANYLARCAPSLRRRPVRPTSQRRLQLANWITRPDNPLALRVIVNRLWQHHFGRGLVESSSDFGKMGTDPTHPHLLDWLATEPSASGVEVSKHLHRIDLVRSSVYRQASRPTQRAADGTAEQQAAAEASWKKSRQLDPENRWLARMNRQRLEGEAIRDSMLAVAERLSSRRGGPGVRPPLPAEVTATLLANQWKVSPDEEDHRRRSIYLFVRRNLRYPLFEAFDRPDTNASCPRRNRSTIAPQALIALNSECLSGCRTRSGGVSVDRPCRRKKWPKTRWPAGDAGLCTDARSSPSPEETAIAGKFLEQESDKLKTAGRTAADLALPNPVPTEVDVHRAAALIDFCLALFNLNEFVYVD